METVCRYASPVMAEAAAAHLRANGVLAKVLGQMDTLGGISPMFTPRGQFILVIADKQDLEEATLLLEELASDPPANDDWHESVDPDLSRLDPELAPTCPSCGRLLPLDERLEHCPSCGRGADVVGLLVERHGPEVLDPCYEAHEREIPEMLVDRAPLACPRCRFSLFGLEARGRCPECGQAYDKRALIRDFLDHPRET